MSNRLWTLVALMTVGSGIVAAWPAGAAIIRGTGTAALIGGDLTDPENNGDPENNVGYNATFNASEEPSFGGGEAAFNVFDNQVGGGNSKWCCGDQNNFPANPISIDATFSQPYLLTRFTLTSGNDTPDRDPRVWQIQGSRNGTDFVTIMSKNDPGASVWTARDQVVEFDAGVDFPIPLAVDGYTTFRFTTTATNLTTGARFQLAEIEYFGDPVPEPASVGLLMLGAVAALNRRGRRA